MEIEQDQATGASTISDVAEAAGVSVRTVSRVLNGSSKVNQTTREAIQSVIERLGFIPSQRARGLAFGRSNLIGMLHDDPNALVLDAVQRGIVGRCVEHGFDLVVHSSKFDLERAPDDIVAFARRSRVDGLILLPPLSELPTIPAILQHNRVPAVGIAAVRIPAYSTMIVSDERGAAASMADHLMALGHKRIAMISGPRSFFSATERAQGFRCALTAAGLSLPPEFIVEGDYGLQSGLLAARTLLNLPDRPTAIFAANDIMAAAVLKVAFEMNVSVPGDLSVAGFDDSIIASMISPALTSIRRPLDEMARAATDRLIAMVADGALPPPQDHFVELSLVRRESTGAPAAQR